MSVGTRQTNNTNNRPPAQRLRTYSIDLPGIAILAAHSFKSEATPETRAHMRIMPCCFSARFEVDAFGPQIDDSGKCESGA